MKQNQLIIIFVVVLILVGGGAFYGGMVFGKSQSPAGVYGQSASQRFGGAAGSAASRRTGANFVNGDVIAKDSSSITVKISNGGSKIVFFSDATEIGKFSSGTLEDLIVGKSVMATGKTNSDGSITAQTIQIRPAGMPGGPGAGAGNGGNPNSNPNPAPQGQ